MLRRTLEMISCVELTFSPAREEDENERLFLREALRERFEEEEEEVEEEGTFNAPIAAIVAIVVECKEMRRRELHSSSSVTIL